MTGMEIRHFLSRFEASYSYNFGTSCEIDDWGKVRLVMLSVLDETAFDILHDASVGSYEAASEMLIKRFGKPPHICLSQLMALK